MKRNKYSELKKWKAGIPRLPLILKGARQVGKTYLLREFGKNEFAQCHYFNFEEDARLRAIFLPDLNPQRIIEELKFHINTSIHQESDLIIFDEIQACPPALTSLKYFMEKMPGQAICAAGSLLGLHLNSESFPVGCVNLCHLYPLSFEEFMLASGELLLSDFYARFNHKGDGQMNEIAESIHLRFWELFKYYLVVGGLPAVVNEFLKHRPKGAFEACQAVRKLQNDLIVGYMSDIAKHSGKINALHIERLLLSAAKQLGQTHDNAVQKFVFKGVIPGKTGYREISGPLDWLEKASLVIKTMICDRAALPLLAYAKENRFKLYLHDVGLLGAMVEIAPKTVLDYDFGSYKGFLVENFVATELHHTDYQSLYSWQENTSEIEFLLDDNGEIVPLEVKSGNRIKAKSLGVYTNKYHPKTKIILSAQSKIRHRSDPALLTMPLYFAGKLR